MEKRKRITKQAIYNAAYATKLRLLQGGNVGKCAECEFCHLVGTTVDEHNCRKCILSGGKEWLAACSPCLSLFSISDNADHLDDNISRLNKLLGLLKAKPLEEVKKIVKEEREERWKNR